MAPTGARRSSACSRRSTGCCASARWLTDHGVTHVAMEATGIYSMPVYHTLLAHGEFAQVLVCNAGQVKNVPGRKTDLLTELSRDLEEGYGRRRVRPVRFAACDRRWGYASGFGRAGGAAAGLSGGDGDLFQPYRLVDGDCALVVPVAPGASGRVGVERAASSARPGSRAWRSWRRDGSLTKCFPVRESWDVASPRIPYRTGTSVHPQPESADEL